MSAPTNVTQISNSGFCSNISGLISGAVDESIIALELRSVAPPPASLSFLVGRRIVAGVTFAGRA